MRTLLQFLKPYKTLSFFVVIVMLLEVIGALYIPTLVADMINIGIGSGNMDFVIQKGMIMLGVALLSGAGTVLGSFLCARGFLQNWDAIYEMRSMTNPFHFLLMTLSNLAQAL